MFMLVIQGILCILLYTLTCGISDEFHLTIEPGSFTDSEIIVMLGENGTGKTTFIRMLAGRLQPDNGGNT